MEKILFSLKTDFNGRSDIVGLPLLMILYADFYSYLFKYKVEVFDPFFEIEKNIKNYKFKIIKDLDTNCKANAFIGKDLFGFNLSLNVTNLLNERYEKPATYSQNGRQFSFSLRRSF